MGVGLRQNKIHTGTSLMLWQVMWTVILHLTGSGPVDTVQRRKTVVRH